MRRLRGPGGEGQERRRPSHRQAATAQRQAATAQRQAATAQRQAPGQTYLDGARAHRRNGGAPRPDPAPGRTGAATGAGPTRPPPPRRPHPGGRAAGPTAPPAPTGRRRRTPAPPAPPPAPEPARPPWPGRHPSPTRASGSPRRYAARSLRVASRAASMRSSRASWAIHAMSSATAARSSLGTSSAGGSCSSPAGRADPRCTAASSSSATSGRRWRPSMPRRWYRASRVAGGRWAMACRARSGSTVRTGRSTAWARRSRQAATSWATPRDAPRSWRASRSFHQARSGSGGPWPRASSAAHSSSAQAVAAVLVQLRPDGVGQVQQVLHVRGGVGDLRVGQGPAPPVREPVALGHRHPQEGLAEAGQAGRAVAGEPGRHLGVEQTARAPARTPAPAPPGPARRRGRPSGPDRRGPSTGAPRPRPAGR